MKTLNLVVSNREYIAYISPGGYGNYEYMLYEIKPKKHWWSFSKHYVCCGIIWENIKEEIIVRIKKEIEREKELNHLAEQFNNL